LLLCLCTVLYWTEYTFWYTADHCCFCVCVLYCTVLSTHSSTLLIIAVVCVCVLYWTEELSTHSSTLLIIAVVVEQRWWWEREWTCTAAGGGTWSCAGEWCNPCFFVLPANIHDPRVRWGPLWTDACQPAGQFVYVTLCLHLGTVISLLPYFPSTIYLCGYPEVRSVEKSRLLWVVEAEQISFSWTMNSIKTMKHILVSFQLLYFY